MQSGLKALTPAVREEAGDAGQALPVRGVAIPQQGDCVVKRRARVGQQPGLVS